MRTAKQKETELKKLARLKDDDIDISDIPQALDWSEAERGKFYRPVKTQITLRVDADVLAWFKSQGSGYQTAINRALRDHVERSSPGRRLEARTGEPCPESGIWQPAGRSHGAIAITKGQRMPPCAGRSVRWVHLKAA